MYFPVFIELNGRRVLVVGAGEIAERKVESLVAAEAEVTVVSPEATANLHGMARRGAIRLLERPFEESDLAGAVLVITATDRPEVQRQVVQAGRAKGILVNTVDIPEMCDFIVPAVVRRGDVVAAISTSGRSPALAAALKSKVAEVVTEDAGRAAAILGLVRDDVHRKFPDSKRRKEIFESFIQAGLLEWLAEIDDGEALLRVRAILDDTR